MLELLQGLTAEKIAASIVGFVTLGIILRNALLGWREASIKVRSNESNVTPMVAAMGMSWDRDQVERILQTFERIAESLELQAEHVEVVAKAQATLADDYQQSTQSKLNHILDRLKEAEENHHIVNRPPQRRR